MQITAETIPLALLSIFTIQIVVIVFINPQHRPGIKTVVKKVMLALFFHTTGQSKRLEFLESRRQKLASRAVLCSVGHRCFTKFSRL